jgi:hypothetical protein
MCTADRQLHDTISRPQQAAVCCYNYATSLTCFYHSMTNCARGGFTLTDANIRGQAGAEHGWDMTSPVLLGQLAPPFNAGWVTL